MKPALAAGVVGAGISLVAHERFVRPWQQRWGATDAEIVLPLPGDELIAEAATHPHERPGWRTSARGTFCSGFSVVREGP